MTLWFILANDYRYAGDGIDEICHVSFSGMNREEILRKINSQIPDSRIEDNLILVNARFNRLMERIMA